MTAALKIVLALCLFHLSMASAPTGAGPAIRKHRFRPNTPGGLWTLPAEPTNKWANQTYPALMIHIPTHFHKFGAEWMIKFKDLSDKDRIHHYNLVLLPPYAPGLHPNGTFVNAQDLTMLDDALVIGGDSSIAGAGQHGIDTLDFISNYEDIDQSPANGFNYGFPIGAQTNFEWLAIQAHAHNDGDEAVDIRIEYEMTTTTRPPKNELGVLMTGVLPPQPNFPPYDRFMNLQKNADDEYSITARTYPAVADCSAQPEAVPCESCCPSGVDPAVFPTNSGEGEMLAEGLTSVKLISAFLHTHHKQKRAEYFKIDFDGNEVPLANCTECGGGQPNVNAAFQYFEEPVDFKLGEGLGARCVYEMKDGGHHGGHHKRSGDGGSESIVGGYGKDEEMCLMFSYFATPILNDEGEIERTMENPGAYFLYSDICNYVENEGYPNEENSLGHLEPFVCHGACPRDPAC
jgi:hypothetical protein